MANVTYVVQKGDTLSAIAKKYNTTVDVLQKLNDIPNANVIFAGQTLIISGTPAAEVKTTGLQAANVTVGLQADTDRTLIARWDFSKSDTDHYLVRWWWGAAGSTTNGILAVEDEKVSTTWRGHVWTAPQNAERASFYVKPVAKTTKDSKGNEISPWTGTWSTKATHYFRDNPPVTPNVPSVEIKDYTLTATIESGLKDLNADSIEFYVCRDNAYKHTTEKVDIVTYYASCTVDITPGHTYKVRARSWRNDECSDWSEYSGNQNTKPDVSDGIKTCKANSTTSVFLSWSSVANAESYDIEYTTKREYFDSSNSTFTETGIESDSYILTGLESGKEYFFRVRAVNDQGYSAWSGIKSVVLGKKPSAPTTWSSTTTAIIGEPLILYWVHNSEDGSKQVRAELELDINGKKTTKTIDNPTADDEEAEEKTSSYSFDTSGYTEGVKLQWRVRTCGITGEYSDWSIQRAVDIYAPPSLSVSVTDLNGNDLDRLTSFPFHVKCLAGPNSQKPISYYLSVVSEESYETTDRIGNEAFVTAGSEVYAKFFDISENLETTLSANDLDLENNIRYTVKCTVTMNSGLSTEASASFVVAWTDESYPPNAELGVHEDTYSAVIRPYCEDENEELIDGVTLGVYRREFDGSFTEIATGLKNTRATFVVDPHPALDYARYRIVAISTATGSVSYSDLPGYPVGGVAVIIQWDDKWTDFDVVDGVPTEDRIWSGSMLKLPYNIDVSSGHKPDVSLVEYIGRRHPVSYYGTQIGETATWSTAIPKSDKETLYALRRLSTWMGNVYVREPSGSGYWANITVSFNVSHLEVTIPITLNITRVEGGL